MALTPPTAVELAFFAHQEPYATEELAYINAMLAQSTDAIWATTGIEDYPTDPRMARIVRYAIMQFALWLISQDEHRDEINAPFSSERIGSYSYSKMQQGMRGEETGIFWLDMLFKMLGFTSDGADSVAWSSSEFVFNPDGLTYAQQEWLDQVDRDSFYYWGVGF